MIHATDEHAARRVLNRLAEADVIRRIWAGDHTVWSPLPDEITNRLGWLRAPANMREHLDSLRSFAATVREEGCDAVALIGMGGSSLAPETLAAVQGAPGPRLVVLDSTHPAAVRRALDGLRPARTFVLVSTKSGTTTETLALFRTVYGHVTAALGAAAAGKRFAAITDLGSPLVDIARAHGFRRTFLNDPTIGGRYAALSLVGLVPAALLGLDLELLLDGAQTMAARCSPSTPLERNPAALVAALLGAHVAEGRDKATFVIPDPLASFGDWVEQLVAESTGKHGTGLLPVVGEPLGSSELYGGDRVFVHLGPSARTPEPIVTAEFGGPEALGGQFFLWEMATALLGHLLGVNPFDQPDVESAKRATREVLREHDAGAAAAWAPPSLTSEALGEFVAQAAPGDYVAILAYLDPRPEVFAQLAALRRMLRDRTRCATTLGFGPRYLHSTGQLHKGDAGRGLFVVLTDTPTVDVAVPQDGDRSLSFRRLLHAQAAGDVRALAERGRRVAAFSVGDGPLPVITPSSR